MEKIFSKIGLLFISALAVVMLGVSYGGYTGFLTTDIKTATGNMDFLFSEEGGEEFALTIQNSEMEEPSELDANFLYDGKTLRITDIGPIDINMLSGGDLRIDILFLINASEDSTIKKAIISDKSDNNQTNQEPVVFDRMSKTPKWTIKCGSYIWGSENSEAGGVPEIVYRLLPDEIGDFYMTQSLITDENEGQIRGVLTLEQAGTGQSFPIEPVLLSSFELPSEIGEEMMAGEECELIMQAKYALEIPIDLDQFNYSEMGL